MYAASFGLVIVALITLIVGVFQSGLTWIWVSIGASVAAALFLAVGVLQKKPVQPATAGAPYGPPPGSPEPATGRAADTDRDTAVMEAPATRRREAVTAPPSRADEEEETAPPARPKRAPSKKAPAKRAAKSAPRSTGGKATAAKGAAKKSTAKASASGGQVVAIPERGTYHQATCRFVKGRRDTEKMTKAAAGRQGFTACGVCRP